MDRLGSLRVSCGYLRKAYDRRGALKTSEEQATGWLLAWERIVEAERFPSAQSARFAERTEKRPAAL